MKLVNPSFEIYEQGPGLEGIYEAIERAGRTCYKSTRPEGQTAKDFVDRMVASQHYAMLEHGTVYLKIPVNIDVAGNFLDDVATWTKCKLVQEELGNWWAVTTNYRRIIELGYQDYLQYLCEPTEFHKKRITVHFVCDRGVSHEFVRHRVFSFAQESTRYCNYSKDKFGNELTFIAPSWLTEYHYDGNTYSQIFLDSLKAAEGSYLDLLKKWEEKIPDARYKTGFRNNPWTPQQARQVLPNALKTELVMTGFISDWQHFFDLRARGTTGAPHPDAKALAEPLMQEFIKINLITE